MEVLEKVEAAKGACETFRQKQAIYTDKCQKLYAANNNDLVEQYQAKALISLQELQAKYAVEYAQIQ